MSQQTTITKKPYVRLTPDKLNVLSDMVVDNIEDIFDYFCVKYTKGKKFYYGPCPIHEGDGSTNPFNLYYEGYSYRGNWKCRSHGCERTFKKTSIGCVRGLISHKDFKWHSPGDKIATFKDTIDWLFGFFKTDGSTLKVNRERVEKKRFANAVSWINPEKQKNSLYIPRYVYKTTPTLRFSSAYLNSRGFGQDIIDRFDIAECIGEKKEMSNRLVVPVYDDYGHNVIGVTGRSLFNRCLSCKGYHADGPCPNDNYLLQYKKWRHNKGFAAEDNLYNFWYAKEEINKLHSVILVESPFNVMRLYQSGIINVVGTFGAYLNDNQLSKLFQTELYTVNLLYDNDDAGRKANEDISSKISRVFNINTIKTPEDINDVGEMNNESIKQVIIPQIRNH